MINFILRRLVQTIVVLSLLSFVTYGLMGLMPGDPLDVACAANPKCTPENLAELKATLGLDRPITVRYIEWVGTILKGELGYSRIYRAPVTEIMGPRLVNTLILGFSSLLVSLLIAIPVGLIVSLKPNSKRDYFVNLLTFAGISAPSFWLGLIFIIVFAVKLGWFPAGGVETIGDDPTRGTLGMLLDRAKYLVLPVATLSCLTIAGWVRYIRASMIETMRSDYIRTAKAKGLLQKRIIVKHALRNALLPFVTVVTLEVPRVVSGALITETVFSYQGLGKLMYDSIIGNDFNVAMCCFILTCFMVLVMALIADIAYAYLDPRITLK